MIDSSLSAPSFVLSIVALLVTLLFAAQARIIYRNLETQKNQEQDRIVLSLLNTYKNFIINLKSVRRFQKIVKEKKILDKPVEDNLLWNLKWNVDNSVVRKCDDFAKLLEFSLKYHPERVQGVINSSGIIFDGVKKLESDNLDEHILLQIEIHITFSIRFLVDYVPSSKILNVHIENYLEFYNKHLNFIVSTMGKIAEDVEHPDYSI